MPQARCTHLDAVSQKWRLLAERRVTDLVELYKGGRWNRYFSAEAFLLHIERAVESSARWAEIAPRPSAETEQEHHDRPCIQRAWGAASSAAAALSPLDRQPR